MSWGLPEITCYIGIFMNNWEEYVRNVWKVVLFSYSPSPGCYRFLLFATGHHAWFPGNPQKPVLTPLLRSDGRGSIDRDCVWSDVINCGQRMLKLTCRNRKPFDQSGPRWVGLIAPFACTKDHRCALITEGQRDWTTVPSVRSAPLRMVQMVCIVLSNNNRPRTASQLTDYSGGCVNH